MRYALVGLALFASSAVAAPLEVAQTGRVLDAGGGPINGTVTLTFTLYDGAGNDLWGKAYSGVVVEDGFYAVTLSGEDDAATPRALDTTLLDNPEVWLGVRVGSDPELSPRTRLLHVPYAGRAASVPVASGATACATGDLRWNPTALSLEACHEGVWLGIGPGGITMVDGVRRWANGTYAPSCEAYRNGVGGSYTGHTGDGLYLIDPDGDGQNAFDVYCDMTTDGGGWTMCYTESDSSVDFVEETTSGVPYGADGHRRDCRTIPFSEVIYVRHSDGAKAWFSRNTPGDVRIDAFPNTGSAWGLWTPHGVASTAWSYQVMSCNTSMYVGLMTSGYTDGCYKQCNSWCGDRVSHYYRAYGSPNYTGFAFAENGHHNGVTNKTVSVGIR